MPPEPVRHWTAARVHAVQARAATAATPWHDHDHLVLGLVDRGARVVALRDARFEVGAGQGFVLPPHVAHRCLDRGGVDCRVLCLDAPAPPTPCPGWGRIACPDWRAAFDRAFALTIGGDVTLDNALTALTALATSLVGALAPSSAVEPRAVRQTRRDLLAELAERKTLQGLARGAGLSPFHLERLYLRCTGLTPHQQQTLARLRRVRTLLGEGVTLSDAAAACGFADQSHLNRVFKRLMGVPPGRYRAQLRAGTGD
jgi:AraC-like DNA-binding protein